MLTRQQMINVLNARGSVILNGEHIFDVAGLPSEAALAKGDKKKEAEARENLRIQQADIAKQLAILEDSKDVKKDEAAKGSEAKADKGASAVAK